MAEDRKVFPIEQVLELVTGKKDADTRAITSFITGRPDVCPVCSRAAAPFAFAWLARWYPRFSDMEWKEGQSWESFVNQAKNSLGDNISLIPMKGRLKDAALQTLDVIKDTQASLTRQTEAVVKLEKEVAGLKPFESIAATAQKKCDDLEERVKTMKKEMTTLNRKALEFEGKIAVDHETLIDNIKEAIKDGLKGISIGSAVAGTVQAAAGSEAPHPDQANKEPADEFGFGSSSDDEFGF